MSLKGYSLANRDNSFEGIAAHNLKEAIFIANNYFLNLAKYRGRDDLFVDEEWSIGPDGKPLTQKYLRTVYLRQIKKAKKNAKHKGYGGVFG